MLFEEYARLLLVLHTVAAMAAVALSTHLVFWMRPLLRGRFGIIRSTRRFALLSLAAFASTMLLGLALYPTYKIRVRAEYLENPSAITRGVETSSEARLSAERHNLESLRFRRGEVAAVEVRAQPPDPELVGARADQQIASGARMARWFDVKEHWAALGLMLSAAIAFILLRWKPDKASASIAKPIFALSLACALTAWGTAIIGILTAASRSVAAL